MQGMTGESAAVDSPGTLESPDKAQGEEGNSVTPVEGMQNLHIEDGTKSTAVDGEAAIGTAKEGRASPLQGQAAVPQASSLSTEPDKSVVRLIEKANGSAGKLVNLLAKHFASFCDETRFDGRRVRLMKRAQIFVADLWAAFNGTGYGAFDDIDHLTMFAGGFSSDARAVCTAGQKLMQPR